jgi:hypothetical protein
VRFLLRALSVGCVAVALLFAATPASASELIQDPNVALTSLQVNAKGEALVTYKRSNGTMRRVLAWGAINALPPYSFVPQQPFAGYPSQELRPAANGERYRITVGGPGVTPIMQVEVPGLTAADRDRDREFNAVFDRLMGADRICAPER